MSEHISKEQAQEIVYRYLALELQKRCAEALEVHDGIPDNICVYLPSSHKKEDCWCIYVPNLDGKMTVGSGRYICISKKTGDVIFDGFSGE